MESSVVVVEDDAELRGLLLRGLQEHGFRVTGVANGSALLEHVATRTPDALVVDIGLPDADGRDVCRALRADGVMAPVLFLTARDGLADRLAGFRAGGDDYLTKPVALAELAARLQALIRRSVGAVGNPAGAGLRLDPVQHAIVVRGERVMLTPTEFRLLAVLVAGFGGVVRRRELVRVGWGDGALASENSLDVYVARLRRKLDRFADAPEIVTIHGVGYTIR